MWRNSGWTVWHIQDIIPQLHKYLFCIQTFFVPRHRLQGRNCRRKLVTTIKAISIIASLLWKMAVDCKILKSYLVKYCRSSSSCAKFQGTPLLTPSTCETSTRWSYSPHKGSIIISFLNISMCTDFLAGWWGSLCICTAANWNKQSCSVKHEGRSQSQYFWLPLDHTARMWFLIITLNGAI